MRTLSLSSTSEESNCALDARIADSNVPVSLYALTVDAGSARSGAHEVHQVMVEITLAQEQVPLHRVAVLRELVPLEQHPA
jgi:hypothetical protein